MRWNSPLIGKITFLWVLLTLPVFSYRKGPVSDSSVNTYQKEVVSHTGFISPDDLREAQLQVVKAFKAKGHENLMIIHGEDITDAGNLKPAGSKDKVHFTIEGAAKFAGALGKIVKP